MHLVKLFPLQAWRCSQEGKWKSRRQEDLNPGKEQRQEEVPLMLSRWGLLGSAWLGKSHIRFQKDQRRGPNRLGTSFGRGWPSPRSLPMEGNLESQPCGSTFEWRRIPGWLSAFFAGGRSVGGR